MGGTDSPMAASSPHGAGPATILTLEHFLRMKGVSMEDVPAKKLEASIKSAQDKLQDLISDTHGKINYMDKKYYFQAPVTDDIAPMYSTIISEPMDLGTVRARLSKYKTLDEFEYEMKLIFKNCMKYNTPDTPFYKDAEKLLRKTDNHLVKNRRDYEKTLKKLANDLTKGQVKHINSGGSNSGAIPASASKTNSGSSARSTPKSTPKVGSMVIKFKMPSMVDEEGPILATPKISFETSQLNDGSQARKRKDDIGVTVPGSSKKRRVIGGLEDEKARAQRTLFNVERAAGNAANAMRTANYDAVYCHLRLVEVDATPTSATPTAPPTPSSTAPPTPMSAVACTPSGTTPPTPLGGAPALGGSVAGAAGQPGSIAGLASGSTMTAWGSTATPTGLLAAPAPTGVAGHATSLAGAQATAAGSATAGSNASGTGGGTPDQHTTHVSSAPPATSATAPPPVMRNAEDGPCPSSGAASASILPTALSTTTTMPPSSTPSSTTATATTADAATAPAVDPSSTAPRGATSGSSVTASGSSTVSSSVSSGGTPLMSSSVTATPPSTAAATVASVAPPVVPPPTASVPSAVPTSISATPTQPSTPATSAAVPPIVPPIVPSSVTPVIPPAAQVATEKHAIAAVMSAADGSTKKRIKVVKLYAQHASDPRRVGELFECNVGGDL